MCFATVRLFLVLATVLLCASSLRTITEWSETEHVNRTCSTNANCPLWAVCINNTCDCIIELNNAITCNIYSLQLSVLMCYCMTFDSERNDLIQGNCIETCETSHYKFVAEHLLLPINVSQLNSFMCEKTWNRTGRLCGKCLPRHSPLVYSYNIKCVHCPDGNKNVWKYILVAFGPLTIFYFFVLLLKINVTSSYLHGYIIFSQIIGAPVFARNVIMYTLSHPETAPIAQTLGVMYTMWNLDFF